jgi:hypothetical protein
MQPRGRRRIERVSSEQQEQQMTILTRRRATAALAACTLIPWTGLAASATLPNAVVSKDPSCGCCGGWVEHLRAAGFAIEVNDTAELNRVKARLGVPAELHACHTAEIAGYVIEGHVPAAAIERLLREKPQAKGLAVPGMPVGSPGMEVPGSPPEEYTVFIFGDFGKRQYARFKEVREIGAK